MTTGRDSFGRLEFSGDRFEKHGMPIAAMLELRRFEVLIEEVAVELYKREHPKRERAARGFRASFDLRVTEFQEGCVEAVLARPANNRIRLEVLASDYFDKSRDMVHSEILAFAKNGQFSSSFPVAARSRLAALGRGLRTNEVVGLKGPASEGWARLDSQLRNVLSEAVDDAPSSKDTVVLGQITGLESRPHQLSFFLSDEQRVVKGTFTDQSIWDTLLDKAGYQRRAPMVALSAKVKLSQTGEPEFIEDVFNIQDAVPVNLADQISQLVELGEDGWFNGEGKAISQSTVDKVERLAQVIGTSIYNDVTIFPRPDGGVQFEWDDAEFELDVLPSGQLVGYAFDESRDEDGEREFSPSDAPESVISWLYGEEYV